MHVKWLWQSTNAVEFVNDAFRSAAEGEQISFGDLQKNLHDDDIVKC